MHLSNIIYLIGENLQKEGFHVVHCKGDADLDIVKTAVLSAKVNATVVIGEDTDLLVLLCYYSKLEDHRIAQLDDIIFEN